MSKKNLIKIIVINILLIVLVFSASVEASRFNMSYLYGNYNYSELVTRTGNSLNEVSPSYFDLQASGNLKLNTIDTDFINEMHLRGIKVLPFLSNHWDKDKGRAALANIEILTDQIRDAIIKYSLDGVNVDIENVTEKDKDNYILLVKRLREKLGNDKIVSVAVAANPYNWQTGWHGSYDYAGLAKYADYLMVMTYDEHYEGGDAGPVASIDFVEKSIQYALERVEASKIVLGIPFFGRYWKDGVYYGGYGISLSRIQTLTSKYQTRFTYDEETKSAKATMTIKSSNIKPTVNGRTLNTGTYTIWYENEESIKAKLSLVNKYNLKGTGSWSLGQETAETWEYYMTELNNNENSNISLPEMPGSEVTEEADLSQLPNLEQVQTPSNWAVEAVEYVKTNGWMKGKTEKDFYPKDKLTRAEFATIIVRILEIENNKLEKNKYADTKGHWAEKYIDLVTSQGYMNGYDGDIFKPEKNITREEIAKVLAKLDLEDKIKQMEKTVNFNDIKESDWSYNYIVKMAKLGILKGYDDGSFKPKKEISREEIAVILSRIF